MVFTFVCGSETADRCCTVRRWLFCAGHRNRRRGRLRNLPAGEHICTRRGKAAAGIRNRFAAGVVFGEDLYDHISGEIRYIYHDGHAFLSSGGVKTDMQGQSHTFTYDLLFH